MLTTVALVGFLCAAVPSAAQPPQPAGQAPPFTLDGVRRAAAAAEKPPEAPAETEPQDAPRPSRPLSRAAAKQQFDIQSWMPGSSVRLPHDDRLVTTSLAPAGSAWHQEFLAMTQLEYGASPFDMMGNAERVQAVATSMAFAAAIDGLGRLVHHVRKSYREGKIQKIRREIDEETAIVERLYKEKKAAEAAEGTPVRKTPR